MQFLNLDRGPSQINCSPDHAQKLAFVLRSLLREKAHKGLWIEDKQ